MRGVAHLRDVPGGEGGGWAAVSQGKGRTFPTPTTATAATVVVGALLSAFAFVRAFVLRFVLGVVAVATIAAAAAVSAVHEWRVVLHLEHLWE